MEHRDSRVVKEKEALQEAEDSRACPEKMD
jgi:hypothetical protein